MSELPAASTLTVSKKVECRNTLDVFNFNQRVIDVTDISSQGRKENKLDNTES